MCVCVCACECVFLCRTQVHVDSTRPLRVGHVLVDGVEYLLLHLGDGVTVQHLDWNLRAVFVVGVHAVQNLGCRKTGKRIRRRKREARGAL